MATQSRGHGTPVPADPAVRAVVRIPGRAPVVVEGLGTGSSVPIGPMVSLRLGERWGHAVNVEVPRVVPEARRDKAAVGNHREAAVAVRVEATGHRPQATAGRPQSSALWSKTVWLPFTQYLGVDSSMERVVELPDGRSVTLVFGRARHAFPGMMIQLMDFEMIPYPHSDTPRDYKSELLVLTNWGGEFDHAVRPTSLNAPLLVRVPWVRREDVPWFANAAGWLVGLVAPNQYKFSQAGWDSSGWTESRARVERGEVARPFARFTILGVGNNPGIYVIATGGVMMAVGIPWAFYVKPWLVRRKKRRIQEGLGKRVHRRDAEGAEKNGERSFTAGHAEVAGGNGEVVVGVEARGSV